MKRLVMMLSATVVVVLIAFGLYVYYRQQKPMADQRACIRNLRDLYIMAVSLYIENYTTNPISPDNLLDDFGYRALRCPLGTAPYPPFELGYGFTGGPRCPYSEEHTRAFQEYLCAERRGSLWDAAIAYAVSNRCTWDLKVVPGDPQIEPFFAPPKARGWCLLGTNEYPPFVLADGPRCPWCVAHNEGRLNLCGHWPEFFRGNGTVKTNVPITAGNMNTATNRCRLALWW